MYKQLILILIGLLLLCGCKTITYVPTEVPVEIHDTIKDLNVVIIRDSIYEEVTTTTKGDTVYKDKIKYVNKYIQQTDTVTQVKEVPVEITKTITKEVSPWYEKYLIFLSIFGILLIFILIIKKFI